MPMDNPGDGGSLTPAVFSILLLVRLVSLIGFGVTVRNTLVDPIITVDTADPEMLFPRNVALVFVTL